jgi:Zn-finger protein
MTEDWVQQSPDLKYKYDMLQRSQQMLHPNRKFLHDHTYFENRSCIFFPCHPEEDIVKEGFNCMFCRCPYYNKATCPGIESGVATILENGCKDCTNCAYNHKYENRVEMSLAYVTKEEM